MLAEYEKAINIIEKNKTNFFYEKDICEADISKAENRLGIKFTLLYRDYLKRYGSISSGAYEIYGIIKSDDYKAIPNAVWLNLNERKQYNFPNNLFIIGSTGYGGWYALDLLNVTVDNFAKVVIVTPSINGREYNKKLLFNNFGEFMMEYMIKPLVVDRKILL